MKKSSLLLFAAATMFLASCNNTGFGVSGAQELKVREIDSCEYVTYTTSKGAAMTHKHNCKFCKSRENNNEKQ